MGSDEGGLPTSTFVEEGWKEGGVEEGVRSVDVTQTSETRMSMRERGMFRKGVI